MINSFQYTQSVNELGTWNVGTEIPNTESVWVKYKLDSNAYVQYRKLFKLKADWVWNKV